MNAVVYARYSSHKQGEQSIEGQLAEAYKYAAEHGLTIIHEYADRAMTGRNDNWAQFQLMMADATKGIFDALIVWKTDRIGRNKEEIALNKYHLKKNGVKIYYIPDMPEGLILESVINGMAAYYSEQLSQNVKRGQRQSVSKAQSTGGTRPLGYMTGPDKKFVIDPKTAPAVRKMFELYSEGWTIIEIVKYLNEQGHRSIFRKCFTKNSLRTVLKNEKYIGVYTYKNEIRIEDAIPPIIEKELFCKVQEMLKYNQKAATHKNSKAGYLLTKKLFCGKCGKQMVGYSGTSETKTIHFYYCCTGQKQRLCTKKAVRKDWIENLIIEFAVSLLQDDELLEFIAENTYQYYKEQNTDSAYTDSLNASLINVKKSIDNLIKAMEAGIFNDATKARMDELDAQKIELEAALADSKLRIDLGIKKDHILYFLQKFKDFDYQDIDCQKRLIKTFINSVFVYDDKVVITFNYSGDRRIITVQEIDAGLVTGVRAPRAVGHQIVLRADADNVSAFVFFILY